MLRPGFRINDPGVIFQLFDDEVVAIHLASGTYHSLQGIAGEAFQILGIDGGTSEDVAARLSQIYDASAEQIERDLHPFFMKLESEELIAPSTVAARPAPEPKVGQIRASYYAPDFQTHRDLQQLFLIDPVHDVDATGWPNLPVAGTEAGQSLECHLSGPHVVYEKMAEETVVIHTVSGAYHSLTGPAEDIFLLIESEPLIEEISAALTGKYDAPLETIEKAVREFVSDLTAAGLITTRPALPGRLPKRLAPPGLAGTWRSCRCVSSLTATPMPLRRR